MGEATADVRSLVDLGKGTIQLLLCPDRHASQSNSKLGPAGCKPTDVIMVCEEPIEQCVSQCSPRAPGIWMSSHCFHGIENSDWKRPV